VETGNWKEILFRYFSFQKVLEPGRPEKITSGIQEKSCNQAKWIDLRVGFYDIARRNLRKEIGNKKK
jgi:hypothetical protein